MYIPEFNRVEDRAVALAFMRANPFAILISNVDGIPFATHLPLLVKKSATRFCCAATWRRQTLTGDRSNRGRNR